MKKVYLKSALAGILMMTIDYVVHSNYANHETLNYFIFKFIIASYVAYFAFENKFNYYKLKQLTLKWYAYYGILFAGLHGLYYRFLEYHYGKMLFSRVGTIGFMGIQFSNSSIFQSIIGWLLVHGGAFIIALFIVHKLDENEVI